MSKSEIVELANHPELEDNDAIQSTLHRVAGALKGYWDRNNIEEAKRRGALLNEIRMYYGLEPVGIPHFNGEVLDNQSLQNQGIQEVDFTPEEEAKIENKANYVSTKGAGDTKRSDTVAETFREQVPEEKKEFDKSDTATVVTDDPTEYAQEPYLTDYPSLDDAGYNETRGEATGFTGVEEFDPAPMMTKSDADDQERDEQDRFTGYYDPEERAFGQSRAKRQVQQSAGESAQFSSVQNLTDIRGIGDKTAQKLSSKGIDSTGQLKLKVKENPQILDDLGIPPVHREKVKTDLGLGN